MESSRGEKSARAAGMVSAAVMASRVLGLVREQVFAKLFGAGLVMDAWNVAFRIPNMLRDLFAEGALSSAFVPTFTEILKQDGKRAAWHLANLVLSLLLILLGLFAFLLFFFSDYFVYLLAGGYATVPGKVEITSSLIRILSPFLMLIAMASVAMGMLNTLNYYFVPALAPAFFNLAVILAGLFMAPYFDEQGLLPIYAMGLGALVGGILQFLVQIPLLRREGFRVSLGVNLKHPGIQKMTRLIGPAIVGVSAVQVNIVVNTQLASFLQANGPVSWLSYAFRVIYLPIGLFGVAVGVVNLKEVSAFAAARQWDDLKETVANSVKLIGFLSLPSTVGLMVLAVPIIEVLFERGDFTSADTRFTAYALMAYSLGLFAYSLLKVYGPTFYALDDTRTPVRASIAAVIANLLINITLIYLLPEGFEYIGLAFGTAVSVSLNCFILSRVFKRRLGTLMEYRVFPVLWRAGFCAVLMGLVVYFVDTQLQARVEEVGVIPEVLILMVSVGSGVLVYVLSAWMMGIEEVRYLMSFFKNR